MTVAHPARAFVIALGIAVVIADALRWILVSTRDPETDATAVQTVSFGIQLLVNGGIVVAIAATIGAFARRRMPSRRLLKTFGILVSANMAITIGAISLAIYVRGADSYRLLIESFALYFAVNLIFLFWYWYADYPLGHGIQVDGVVLDLDQGIQFPEEVLAAAAGRRGAWQPGVVDYAYFTLLSSNCLGAPEGHMLVGRTLKSLQVVHTLFMVFLFVILLSRAVNTLS